MKTKHHSRRGLSRLVAILLCALCVIGLFPMSAFALEPGTKASSWMGDQYLASDGDTYYHPAPWYSMTYHEDGSTSYVTHGGGAPYNHYMLTDSSGVTHTVYCIESGIDYGASDNAYTAASGKDSNYFKRIPASAQRGIELAALYGWQPGASLPISGINADDWKMATQVIIWEYQQQLRTGPRGRQNNGSIYADQFYNVVKGRPAEAAYNYILQQISRHSVIPSFTAASAANAPVLELKWDSGAKIYTLTVTDTNGLNIDLERLSGSGVSITRNGSSYTFTSKNMIENPVTFTFRKNVKIADQMLIWGRPGYQTMMTGASDPVTFSVKVKTETYGTAKIVKTSEDGIVSGISFNIKGSGVDQTIKTDNSGTISHKLLPGSYTVTELPCDRYVAQKPQTVTIESGQTATVHFSNILKKFRVKGYKVDAETGDAQGDATLGGAVYGKLPDMEPWDLQNHFIMIDEDGRLIQGCLWKAGRVSPLVPSPRGDVVIWIYDGSVYAWRIRDRECDPINLSDQFNNQRVQDARMQSDGILEVLCENGEIWRYWCDKGLFFVPDKNGWTQGKRDFYGGEEIRFLRNPPEWFILMIRNEDYEAMYANEDVRRICFEPGLETIKAYLLFKTSLEKVVIPAHVQDVEAGAFSDCADLKELVIEGDLSRVANWAEDAFEGCPCEEYYKQLRNAARQER